MEVFLVGGAVRDYLLGKTSNDRDYVVVGSTPEEMLAKGFKQVGNDFPVFLNEKGEEYALARTERKTGNGHKAFECIVNQVSLKEDLGRRDFTVNALAMDEETDKVFDYYGGIEDLKNRVLRMIDKKSFMEDPLRVFRLARFAAQLDFDIDPDTKFTCYKMAQEGMLKELSPERVWKELEKALQPGYASHRFFETLLEICALDDWFPEFKLLSMSPEQKKFHWSENSFKHTMIALKRVQNCSSKVKFATVCHDLGKGMTPQDILPKHIGHDARGEPLVEALCERLKAPNDFKKLALTVCKYHMRFHMINNMRLRKQYLLIKAFGNFRDREFFEDCIKCFFADEHGEEVSGEFRSEEKWVRTLRRAISIFNVLENVNLESFDKTVQERLKRFEGEKFGELYENEMIRYLEDRIETEEKRLEKRLENG